MRFYNKVIPKKNENIELPVLFYFTVLPEYIFNRLSDKFKEKRKKNIYKKNDTDFNISLEKFL